MPELVYSKAQIDAIMAIVGSRIDVHTDASTIQTAIEGITNVNFMTDAEKTKLASLEGSKFLGVFANVGSIPTVSAVPGSYADVDQGVGQNVTRYVWDDDDSVFVQMTGAVAGETAASVKTKYESNPDTNAFTDAEKTKLANLQIASNTTDAVAALDGAIT